MDVETKEEKSKYVSNCFAVFTTNSILLFVVLVLVRLCTGWEMALFFYLMAIGEIYNLHLRGYLRALKRLDIYSFINAITTVLIAVFVTIFVRGFQMGLKGIVLGYGLGYIIGDLLIALLTKYWTYLDLRKISFSGMKELVSYSYALIPNSIAWWFINVSDRTIIKVFLGAAANGVYAIAYKVPNILSAIFNVFSVSWQQAAIENLNDADRDVYFNKVYNKLLIVLLSLCCGILSLNSWLFNYIFDSRYYEGHLYVPLLIGGAVFATLSQFYGSLQISFKQPKENGVTTVVGALSNILIHLALIRFVGLFAAAISTLCSQIIVCVLRNVRLRKMAQLKMDKKTIAYFGIYLLYTCLAFYITNPFVNAASVLAACILVIASNKSYAVNILKGIRKNKVLSTK
jgi:O-antigen/teichoic acid export membrane protein